MGSEASRPRLGESLEGGPQRDQWTDTQVVRGCLRRHRSLPLEVQLLRVCICTKGGEQPFFASQQ